MLQTVYDLCQSSMFTTTFPAKVSSSFFFSLGNLSLCYRRHGLSDENSARTQPKLFPLGEPWRRRLKTSRPARPLGVKKPGKRLRSIVPAITLGGPSVSNRIKTGDMIQFSFCLSVWYGKSVSLFSGSSNGLSFEQSRGKRCILPSNCYIVNFTIFSCLCYPLFISFVCCFIFFLLFLPFSHACVFVGIQEFLPS